MYRALAYKELREVLGIVAVALVCFLALISNLMGMYLFAWVPLLPSGTHGVPFVYPGFVQAFTCICLVFAIALGFRQSLWEDARSRYQLLLHLPMARSTVMITKMLTGIAIYLIASSLPILLYGWWAATPGNHPSPFQWTMTDLTLHVWLSMILLYLGAFLSGIRPGRWLGTRLLPLFTCGLLVPLVVFTPWWWTCGLALLFTLAAILVANVCYVASMRDYS